MLVQPVYIVFNSIDIPCHIQEQFRKVFTGLDIAYIQYPHILGSFVVG